MRVLVTGATGVIGRLLVAELLADDHEVVALTRDPSSARLGAGVDLVRGEPADARAMTGALEGVDAAFLNVIGPPGGLADGLRSRPGVPTVLLSTVTAGTRSELRYALQFADIEDTVTAVMERVTILRPGAFMSNLLWWADELSTGSVVSVPAPDVAIPLVAPDDVAAAARVALVEPMAVGARVLTMLGARLSPVQQADVLAEVLGRPIGVEAVSAEEYRERHAELGADLVEYILATNASPLESELGSTELAPLVGRTPLTLREWAARRRDDLVPVLGGSGH